MFLFTLELLKNMASDNNVSTGVSAVFTFKYLNLGPKKICSMVGVSDITVYTFGCLQVRPNYSHSISIVSNC